MQGEWEFYFANVNDLIASIFVNLEARESAPDPKRPWLLWVWVYFQDPRDDGLSSSKEAPILDEIEDALMPTVSRALNAEMVGRITTAGRREFYFYGATTDGLKEAVAEAMQNFPGYEFDCDVHHEPDWSQYLDCLYPVPEELEKIKNIHLVDQLRSNGDSLDKPRMVRHWAYFGSKVDRDEFNGNAERAGFKIASMTEDDSADAGEKYGVRVERVDSVEWEAINEVTLQLLSFARAVNGQYDGWETSVEK